MGCALLTTRFGLRLFGGRNAEDGIESDGRLRGDERLGLSVPTAGRLAESECFVRSEYTKKAFSCLSPCLSGCFTEFRALLCTLLAKGLRGCRSIVFPGNAGIARLQPWKIGSFSISRTSIFFVRLAKFNELSAIDVLNSAKIEIEWR